MLVLSGSGMSLVFFATPAAAKQPVVPVKSPGETVSVLRQYNSYLGKTILYLGKNCGRFEARSGNLIIYCAAPDWTVVIYRKDDNRAMIVPMAQWQERGFKVMPPKQRLNDAMVTPVFVPILNQVCKEFVLNTNKRFFESNDSLVFRSNTIKNVRKITCITTKGLVLDEKMKLFIHGLYNQPWTDEIPLELKNELSDGGEVVSYSITSIKKEAVPANFFAYPKNYTVVTRHEDIMASRKEEKKARELIDSLIDEYKENPIKDKAHK